MYIVSCCVFFYLRERCYVRKVFLHRRSFCFMRNVEELIIVVVVFSLLLLCGCVCVYVKRGREEGQSPIIRFKVS